MAWFGLDPKFALEKGLLYAVFLAAVLWVIVYSLLSARAHLAKMRNQKFQNVKIAFLPAEPDASHGELAHVDHGIGTQSMTSEPRLDATNTSGGGSEQFHSENPQAHSRKHRRVAPATRSSNVD